MRLNILNAAFLASSVSFGFVNAGLNILLTNDDSWVSANIRGAKHFLEQSGHNVLLVGPATQQSGTGGSFKYADTNITAPGGKFGSVEPGALYYGHEVDDNSTWYFNGTPAACAVFGLDVIAPKYFKKQQVDLLVSGINEGNNLGPIVFDESGTLGATYTLVARGVPGIAFSGRNSTQRYFKDWDSQDANDPATIQGKLVALLVDKLAQNVSKFQSRVLPLGVGLNVNFPYVNQTNPSPEFVNTRLTGKAAVPSITIGDDGFPTDTNIVAEGLNQNFVGDKNLPGETDIVENQGKSAISVFVVDWDAPTQVAQPVQDAYKDIINKPNLI